MTELKVGEGRFNIGEAARRRGGEAATRSGVSAKTVGPSITPS